MDFASINQGIISEESAYIDLKNEIDEVFKNLVDPKLNDFKTEYIPLKYYSSIICAREKVESWFNPDFVL